MFPRADAERPPASSGLLSWRRSLLVLAAVRVAIPLSALAASGHQLPGLPRYSYGPLTGDAPGYLSTARELLSGWRALGAAGLALVALALCAAALTAVRLWRRRPARRAWLVLGLALLASLATAAAIFRSQRGAVGAAGWPLLWSVPLAPLRVADAVTQDSAFAVGLALSLAANAVTVVATAYGGLYATGRRSVGLLAAGLFAFWPLLMGLVAGSQAWGNGTWEVDAGLHLYSEPVSTAFVAAGAALLLAPRLTPTRAPLAGLALAYAVAVRPTNGFLAALGLVLLTARDRRSALGFVAGGLAVVPVVVAFLPKRYGYDLTTSDTSGALFSGKYVLSSWTDSLLWSPRTLLVLLPVAALGALAVRPRWRLAFLVGWLLSNAVFYSFFRATVVHPRYLFASLPAVLILWSAGLVGLGVAARKEGGRLLPARL